MQNDQTDNLQRTTSFTVRGVSYDGMVEQARLRAADLFEVAARDIYVKASPMRVVEHSPFQQDLSTEARPVLWAIDVLVGVKDKGPDENG